MSDEQRTERPTLERRQEARREGRVARSHDLTVAASLLGVFLALESWGPLLAGRCLAFTRGLLEQVSAAPKLLAGRGPGDLGPELVLFLAYCAMPIALVSCAVVLGAHAGQGAWVFVPHSTAPRLHRMNPLEGIARLAGARSWLRGLFAGLYPPGSRRTVRPSTSRAGRSSGTEWSDSA
jgi:flagellar biosynthetic protein FlhB